MLSTSILDTGTYTISITVSDPQPSSVTTSFTLTVTNAAPSLVSAIPNYSVVHGQSISIPLSSYFTDTDGDVITMTATSSFNGGGAVAVPTGIITMPSSFTIDVASTSIADTGTYTITLTV